jgi:phage tail tube protein FII
VTYPIGVQLPAIERKLDVYRAGLKVAEIKITGPSRDLNTVADIIAGECRPGDEARGD